MAWKATTTKNIEILGCVLGTLFSVLPWKCSVFSWVSLLNVFGILGVWSQGVYWDLSSRRRFFFYSASEFLFPAGLGDTFAFPSSTGSSWQWSIWDFGGQES